MKGAKRIAGLLRSSQSLEAVIIDSLWGTHKFDVGDEGAVAIAEAVAMRRAKTTQLVLKNCNISDTGGIALCRLLEKSRSKFVVLDLSRNNFGLSTIRSFVDCLSENTALRTLELSSNQIITSSERVDLQIRLFNKLKTNRTLSNLSIPWMDTKEMSPEEKSHVFAAFRDMLQVNHAIHPRSLPIHFHQNDLDGVMRSANYEHPVLSAMVKNAPFPSYLIDDVPVSVIPDAIKRVDDVAGVDGVFSLLRRVGDGIWCGIVSPGSVKKSKKRRKGSVEDDISEFNMAGCHANNDGSALL